MKKYKNQDLERVIESLEERKQKEFSLVKDQLSNVFNGLKPINLINNTLNDLKNEPEVKQNLLESALSIAGGYFSKKLLFGSSNSVLKRITGYGLQFLMTKLISKKISKTIN